MKLGSMAFVYTDRRVMADLNMYPEATWTSKAQEMQKSGCAGETCTAFPCCLRKNDFCHDAIHREAGQASQAE